MNDEPVLPTLHGDPDAIKVAARAMNASSAEHLRAVDAWYAAGEPVSGPVSERKQSTRIEMIIADQVRALLDPNHGDAVVRGSLAAQIDPSWSVEQLREHLRTRIERHTAWK